MHTDHCRKYVISSTFKVSTPLTTMLRENIVENVLFRAFSTRTDIFCTFFCFGEAFSEIMKARRFEMFFFAKI